MDRADETQTLPAVCHDFSLLTEDDLYLFNEGSHFRIYDKLGVHLTAHRGASGAYFAVWAPNAEQVSVIGDFNGWNKENHLLHSRGQSGIWEGFIPHIHHGAIYKFHLISRLNGHRADKADPVAFRQEAAPGAASVAWDLSYEWNDEAWMAERGRRARIDAPISVHELHLGSWRRVPEENDRPLTYREAAQWLVEHMRRLGFTHVAFLPLMEHSYGSLGYQVTGHFAPANRHGAPQDLMYLVDVLHQNGIGVILDCVLSHFPAVSQGLGLFDGTPIYEYEELRKGPTSEWDRYVFNYGRLEVRSFLISSALYWLDKYHIDGLRVDPVSPLRLSSARQPHESEQIAGRENIEATDFLRRFNIEVYKHYPDAQTVAESSATWPMVSRPVYAGGLGFGYRLDTHWKVSTLRYVTCDPFHRKYHHDAVTSRGTYAFAENYVLPLGHDEVTETAGSLLGRMPGDPWQQFANLRLLYGLMFGQPGKKLLFMGNEFGQRNPWLPQRSLDWHLADEPFHHGLRRWVEDLNQFYRREIAMHQRDCEPSGFEWVDSHDAEQSTVSWLRWGGNDVILALFNFTPVPRHNFRVGVPRGGYWFEALNSDATEYQGSGQGNLGGAEAAPFEWHGRPHTLVLTLPPLAVVFFKQEGARR
jgi:1,4-alpha-glucan branching enzyme